MRCRWLLQSVDDEQIKQMIEVANRNASRAIEDLQDTRRHTEEEITKVKAELMQDQIDDKLVEANLRSITEKMEVLQQLATSSMPAEMSPRVPAPPTTSSYFQSAPPASAQFEKGGQNLVMDELGTVTRRIATLKLELQILSEQDDPESVFSHPARIRTIIEMFMDLFLLHAHFGRRFEWMSWNKSCQICKTRSSNYLARPITS
eukprot:SAG31_NODE_303_length_18065_cov_5.733107_18_plen_204_part_00